MILEYRKLQVELSRSDYEIWLEQWNIERAVEKKHRLYLPGACPWCVAFLREKDCTDCPLKVFGVHDGNHRIIGCLNLLIDILGEPSGDPLSKWGFIFWNNHISISGEHGIENVKKIRNTIENSIVDGGDKDGLESYLKSTWIPLK